MVVKVAYFEGVGENIDFIFPVGHIRFHVNTVHNLHIAFIIPCNHTHVSEIDANMLCLWDRIAIVDNE